MAVKIYIDQGHNPQNPNAGAEGNGYREQDLTYEIGILLAEELSGLGFETRLSRNDPNEVLGSSNQGSLTARVNDANAWGADYFISLHTNAAANPSASGSEALVYSTVGVSAALAEDIVSGISRETGLRNRGVIARPGLYVLRRTKMPAVLVEMGFITNRNDASLMANSPGLFAEGIASGIVNYVGLPVAASPTFNPAESAEISERTDSFYDESASASDGENEAFYADYEAFRADNSGMGELRIATFRGDRVYPVPNVEIRLTKRFADGEYVFYEDLTDEDGLVDGITLFAPPSSNSTSPQGRDRYASYELYTYHPSYGEGRYEIEIFDGVKTVQPVRLTERRGE